FFRFNSQTSCRVAELIGAGINLSVTKRVVGNEFGQAHGRVGIKLNGVVGAKRDLLRGSFADYGRCVENQLIYFGGVTVAGLVETHTAIDKRIIDYDLLA